MDEVAVLTLGFFFVDVFNAETASVESFHHLFDLTVLFLFCFGTS